jgi:Uma2 family endonuclease
MNGAADSSKKVWTEIELQSLPDDGFNYEIVDGELVKMPRDTFQQVRVSGRLRAAIFDFNRKHRLGVVLGSSAGFWMRNRNCRVPDVSFTQGAIRKAAIQTTGENIFPWRPRSGC